MGLIEAVQRNAEGKVLALLKPGATTFLFIPVNIHATDSDGRNAVYWAANLGYYYLLEPLIQAGININQADRLGKTPLLTATENGHTEAMKILLRAGATSSTTDVCNQTPFSVAAYKGDTGLVKLLLDAAVSPNIPDKDGWTPIRTAACHGHMETVKLLLGAHANPNTPDNYGWTPVLSAAFNGHTETLQVLLEAGGNASAETENFWDGTSRIRSTALEAAKRGTGKGHPAIVTLLENHFKNYPSGIKPVPTATSSNPVVENNETPQLLALEEAPASIPTLQATQSIIRKLPRAWFGSSSADVPTQKIEHGEHSPLSMRPA